jgi:hypothetical protein
LFGESFTLIPRHMGTLLLGLGPSLLR